MTRSRWSPPKGRRRSATLRAIQGSAVLPLALLAVAPLAVTLACTPAAPPSEPKVFARLADHFATDEALHGTWRSIGYGWILTIDTTGLEVFHDLGAMCLSDSGQVAGFARYHLSDDDRLELLHHDLGERSSALQLPIQLERLSALPPACDPRQQSREIEYDALYELVGNLFATHYAAFEQRGVDWNAQRDRLREAAYAATTPEALFDVLSDLIEPLRDSHVGLWLGDDRYFSPSQPGLRQELERLWRNQGDATNDAEGPGATNAGSANAFVSAWHRRVKASVIPLLETGTYEDAAAGAVEWGRLSSSVGYLRINRFTRFAEDDVDRASQLALLDDAMDRALRALGDCQRLVVDVSMNGGGFDAAALTVASHFADRERLAYTITPVNQAIEARQMLTPATGVRFHGDVHVLTSEITVSAAEAFVLAMRALPQVRQVGETTRGALSGILPKPLPNRFMVKLAGQIIRDANGDIFEGRGVPPARALPVFRGGDVEGGLTATLTALRDQPPAGLGEP